MEDGIVFEPNPARLRQARRLVSSGVSPRELDGYRPQLRAHVVNFLGQLLESPKSFARHVHR